MTLFLPLEAETPLPQNPTFLATPVDRVAQLSKVIHTIMKAKRIVVICGAGISVQAGIPDFRSPEGLFKTLKRENPRESLTSGKDLFDASVFNSEHTTSLFCQMMAQLSDLSHSAEPTPFHHLLRALDDRGRLLRVYTQNIDAIEQKCGLSFGVPDFEGKRWKGRPKGKSIKNGDDSNNTPVEGCSESPSRLPSPPTETPRCIPLHGTLQSMHCQVCNHSVPLQDYLPSLNAGQPPQCPECTSLEATRQLIGKRPRGIGKLRPSVVLYNEAHNKGEGVGDVVQKDLIGSSKGKGRSGADLLLVVGTSLRVPGTKRMVREFAKAVHARASGPSAKDEPLTSGSTTPNVSPRRSPSSDDELPPAPLKVVYLNLDFPVPTREWEGVFDAWVQGDAQVFADMLRTEIEKEQKTKELASERKRKREEEAAAAAVAAEDEIIDVEILPPTPTAKRKGANFAITPVKRHKMVLPKTPVSPVPPNSIPVTDSDPGPSKLFVRIPSQENRRLHVPEVYITTAPPPQTPARPVYRGLPTPETTPPSRTHQRKRSEQKTVLPCYDDFWRPARYYPTFHRLDILTSSIRSTLEDDERDVLPNQAVGVEFRGGG